MRRKHKSMVSPWPTSERSHTARLSHQPLIAKVIMKQLLVVIAVLLLTPISVTAQNPLPTYGKSNFTFYLGVGPGFAIAPAEFGYKDNARAYDDWTNTTALALTASISYPIGSRIEIQGILDLNHFALDKESAEELTPIENVTISGGSKFVGGFGAGIRLSLTSRQSPVKPFLVGEGRVLYASRSSVSIKNEKTGVASAIGSVGNAGLGAGLHGGLDIRFWGRIGLFIQGGYVLGTVDGETLRFASGRIGVVFSTIDTQ